MKKIELKGENCVFLTDRYVEGIAADSCGINVVLSVRDGTEELPEDRKFKTTTSFENVKIWWFIDWLFYWLIDWFNYLFIINTIYIII